MNILVDIAIGILLYLLQGLLQIPIAFIFRDPFMGSGSRIPTLTYEYLIGAVLIFLITLVFAWIFKTKTKSQAWRRAIIWTLITIVLTLSLEVIDAVDAGSFGWSNLGMMVRNSLGNLGYYFVLLGIFLGPIAFAKIKHLE